MLAAHQIYFSKKKIKIVKESLQKGSVLSVECQQEVDTEVFQKFYLFLDGHQIKVFFLYA
jgi:hypothetical protein